MTDNIIRINRGDRKTFKLVAKSGSFKVGDIIKFSIVRKKKFDDVVLQKKFIVEEEGIEFYFTLTKEDTTIGEIINKPVTYWYEIEYNGDQTIIGYDENKQKEFILMPEAKDLEVVDNVN